MTSTPRRLRMLAMAAAITLYAAVASPQSAGKPPAHDHQDLAEAAPSQADAAGMAGMPRGVMARIAALDERIKTLAADMNMFAGELKIETMAALLTAIVERQSVMREEMRPVHGRMMRRMMERVMPEAPADEEPGGTCAPSP
ncbi:MAG: hypothetical protein HYX77_03250 [Acidobacteria bacterium]|nr:hypothetical protein [Acidobacteriota bacterium]